MKIVTITDAKAHLSSLLKTIEQDKQTVIIQRGDRPIARIVPYEKNHVGSRLGILEGEIEIADDFDALPTDIAQSLGVVD